MTSAARKNIVIGILVAIVTALLARYVIFREEIDAWGEGLERIGDWQEEYRRQNPDATDAEMDAAFEEGIRNIEAWKAQYRNEHPDATEAEIDAAFEAMRN